MSRAAESHGGFNHLPNTQPPTKPPSPSRRLPRLGLQAAVELFEDGLASNTKVKHIKMINNRVDGQMFGRILNTLETNTGLEIVDLRDNHKARLCLCVCVCVCVCV